MKTIRWPVLSAHVWSSSIAQWFFSMFSRNHGLQPFTGWLLFFYTGIWCGIDGWKAEQTGLFGHLINLHRSWSLDCVTLTTLLLACPVPSEICRLVRTHIFPINNGIYEHETLNPNTVDVWWGGEGCNGIDVAQEIIRVELRTENMRFLLRENAQLLT